jgi:hypothetical protein
MISSFGLSFETQILTETARFDYARPRLVAMKKRGVLARLFKVEERALFFEKTAYLGVY